MNLVALFAALLQLGVCAPVQFAAPDGGTLTVLVCPMQTAAEAEGDAPVVVPLVPGKRV
ncbi:MAG: hypothetical protein H7251_02950 [Acetobacteraceae bacterium]|nr:hypothetical protein [Acetobacteraceae bacterium]